MIYKLARANEDQKEIIFDIKKRSIKPYVEEMFGWDDDWQRKFVYANYKPGNIEFILVDDKQIGILEIEENDEEIFLKNILIVSGYQGKGIGTAILNEIIAKAFDKKQFIKLEVLSINNRAEAFYKRVGFEVVTRDNLKICMKYKSRGE